MNELALFAGAGGGILGGKLLGWRTVCAVERDAYAASVLAQRQNDGLLETFPIWSDVTTFDGKMWRGIVDVVSGGFPCQDISIAGRGAGIDGERSGMWREMARIIHEVRPRFVFLENSPILTSRGLGRVLGELASIGFDAEWDVFGAHHVGAPHKRNRIWILAYSRCIRGEKGASKKIRSEVKITERTHLNQLRKKFPNTHIFHDNRGRFCASVIPQLQSAKIQEWWKSEPGVGRVADGVAYRVDKLRAIGNGQVPAVAEAAFKCLFERIFK